jgi:hypothetical protein
MTALFSLPLSALECILERSASFNLNLWLGRPTHVERPQDRSRTERRNEAHRFLPEEGR